MSASPSSVSLVYNEGLGTESDAESTLCHAQRYVKEGWSPIPVPYRSKGPVLKDWGKLRLNLTDLDHHFNGRPSNVGILLGKASAGLIDIDLDTDDAIQLAPHILPLTLTFGKSSTPEAHRIYQVTDTEPPPPIKYLSGTETLLELRSNGQQTLFPGSTHPDGELYVFSSGKQPAKVAASDIQRSVQLLAVAVLCLRVWPRGPGARQDYALGFSGALLRAGLSVEETEMLVEAVATEAGDDEVRSRIATVRPTKEKLEKRERVSGWPTLVELIGETAADQIRKFLHHGEGTLPTIYVGDRDPKAIERDLIRAIELSNDDPELFYRHRKPAKVFVTEDGRPILIELSESAFDSHLTRIVNVVGRGKKPTEIPQRHIKRLLHCGDLPLPPVDAVIEAPALRPDGSVISKSGYDSTTRLYYSPAQNLDIKIPTNPTKGELQWAVEYISELFADFPFVDDASKANTFALLLSPLIRPLLDGGLVPLAGIDAPVAGTGKSLMVDVIALIATGRPAATISRPESEAEFRKQITSILLGGPSLVCLDNIKGRLSSSAFEQVLTSSIWSDRILGRSEQVDLPNRACWTCTGNNVAPVGDLIRRTYMIRLDSGVRRPWTDREFNIPNLKAHVLENRAMILHSALTLVCSWVSASRPVPADAYIIGGFEAWSNTIAGILANASIEGFLDNLVSFYDTADEEDSSWAGLLETIHRFTDGRPFTTSNLASRLSGDAIEATPVLEALPEKVRDRLDTGKSISGSIGNLFRARKDRRFGPEGWRIVSAGKEKRATLWMVEVDRNSEV